MTEIQTLTATMRQVEPNAIERELDNDWRAANAAALASGAHAGARMSVLTLVVYSRDDAQAQRVLRAVGALTSQHPSRCIVVSPKEETENGKPLEAYIRTHSVGSDSTASFGEEIVLRATPHAAMHLAGAILPLIVSGLPAFIWWEGEPPWRSELFEATIDGFDRLLIDTAEMLHVEQSLLALDDVLRRKKASCAVTDFNFARLNPWRELVAQFFDAVELRPYLGAIDRVTIEYAAGEEYHLSNPAQAYLFAGWLASRLGWRAVGARDRGLDGSRQHTLQDSVGRKITLEMNARYGVPLASWFDINAEGMTSGGTTAVGPGALMSVYLRSQQEGVTASFTVARETDLRHASTHCQAPQVSRPSQTIYLPTLGETASLGTELERLTHDQSFEDALGLIAQILEPSSRRAR